MELIKYSAIIPTYNRSEKTLNAIRSVQKQTFPAEEIIVVDDGSDGRNKKNLLDNLRASFGKVRVVSCSRNTGVSAARNLGIRLSTSPWIAFLDSDDIWMPKKMAIQRDALKNSDDYWIHGNEKWLMKGRHLNQKKYHAKQGGRFLTRSMERCLVSPSCVVIHKEVFSKVGFFDEDMEVCEDYDLWLRIMLQFPIRFVEDILIHKNGGHDDQLSRKFRAMDIWRVYALSKIKASELISSEELKFLNELIYSKKKIFEHGRQIRGEDSLVWANLVPKKIFQSII